MSFSLVHFYAKFCVYNKQGTNVLTLINIGKSRQDAEIDLDYQFQNQSTPSTTQITLHNLNNHDYKQIKVGDTIAIWAGWYDSAWIKNNVTHIFTSTINTINPETDSSSDWQMSITCQDGNKFSNEVALSKIYKAKSKSVRRGASGYSSAIAAARKSGNRSIQRWVKKHRNAITKNWNVYKNHIQNEIESNKNSYHRLLSEHPRVKGKGEKAENKRIMAIRRAITSNYRQTAKALEAAKRARSSRNKPARHRIIQKGRRMKAKLRTRLDAKKQKAKRASNKKKTKSKKTSSSGLHFKKNTRAKTIILKLAKIGHIKISKISLIKNHRFTSGYTATKTPWQEIQSIAQDYCNSNIWWPHGELVIGNFAKQKALDFTLTPTTGLTQTPTADNDDDSDDDSDTSTQTMSKKQIKKQEKQNAIANPTTYQVTSVFLPFLTTGSTFRITDPDPDTELPTNRDGDDPIHIGELFNDEVVVQSGELSFGSGDMPTSQFDVVPKSALMKKQKQSDSEKARKAKEAARKDKKKRGRTKAKRSARRAKRVKRAKTRRASRARKRA